MWCIKHDMLKITTQSPCGFSRAVQNKKMKGLIRQCWVYTVVNYSLWLWPWYGVSLCSNTQPHEVPGDKLIYLHSKLYSTGPKPPSCNRTTRKMTQWLSSERKPVWMKEINVGFRCNFLSHPCSLSPQELTELLTPAHIQGGVFAQKNCGSKKKKEKNTAESEV